jgi:type III secretion system (T3SS) inner membrane Yop/YscD-like protein
MSLTSTTIASLTVTAGPDRGKTFALHEEFVHVGRSEDCQVLLTDPQVDDVQASLANRNGRFAIITAFEQTVAVDDKTLTAEKWAWLPAQATIRVSPKTTLLFSCGLPSATSNGEPVTAKGTDNPSTADPPASLPVKSKGRKPGPKKGETTSRTVAKFITDRKGETLVRLGEDGHLPELALAEVTALNQDKRKRPSQGNPALIYGALGFSLLASLAMLFLDPAVMDERSLSKSEARQAVMHDFVGSDKGPIKPYQRLLRDAGLAHSRGDVKSERAAYLTVLRLLNSEDKNPFTGITGTAEEDEILKKHLAVVLAR